jgi:uncharacterized protein YlxW (UPF0749 family)
MSIHRGAPPSSPGDLPDQPDQPHPLPDQITLGLLPYLTAHALDEDYARVAARHERATTERQARRTIGLPGAVAMAVFAVLIVTAAVQTSQSSANQERERRQLIDQVKARKASIVADRRTATKLRAENGRLDSAHRHNNEVSVGVLAELNLLELRSGTSPVHGPGVEIVVDDAKDAASDRNRVQYIDLQKLVNGLWRAGAEAISINGERLTSLSPIRNAGDAITVNFNKLNRPYRILAIGNTKTLPLTFANTTSGREWSDLQRQLGLRFTMRTRHSMQLPAAVAPTLRFADTSQTPTQRTSP